MSGVDFCASRHIDFKMRLTPFFHMGAAAFCLSSIYIGAPTWSYARRYF